MGKSLLIFAGAGSSFGVDRDLFPTTVQFRENLPDNLKNNQLLQQIEAYIKREQVVSTIDIEHTLWEIGKLITNIEHTTKNNSFIRGALETNLINSIVNIDVSGSVIFNSLNKISNAAIQLQNSINSEVYNNYSREAPLNSLQKTWLPLINGISKRADRIDIFTTNYDQIIEQALYEANISSTIHAGFTGGHRSTVNLDYWRNINPKIGLLTKLHGSVDWKIGSGGSKENPIIRHGHPEFDGNHTDRLIIYPGFKGKPKDQPYKLFHDYFSNRISEATHILVIGFAFRDEYINEIFSLNIKSNTKIAIIDPSENPTWPSFLVKAHHIKAGFGKLITYGNADVDQFEYLNHWINDDLDHYLPHFKKNLIAKSMNNKNYPLTP